MKTIIQKHRGGVTLGLLAGSLLTFGSAVWAQNCPDGAGAKEGKQGRWEKRFDANGDGQLDPQEKAAMQSAKGEAKQKMMGRFDKDGDGKLNESEKAELRAAKEAKHQEMLSRFDKDGDGRLSPEEKKAAKEARKTGQANKG